MSVKKKQNKWEFQLALIGTLGGKKIYFLSKNIFRYIENGFSVKIYLIVAPRRWKKYLSKIPLIFAAHLYFYRWHLSASAAHQRNNPNQKWWTWNPWKRNSKKFKFKRTKESNLKKPKLKIKLNWKRYF